MRSISAFLEEEDGATALEYGLIVSLIFLAIVAAVNAVATETVAMWQTVENNI